MQERIIDGRYRICGRIGQGGMSTVYLAEELQTKEQVALKWVRRAQMRRFGISEQDVQREAELMRGIDHPALPRIREQFVSEEGCIIVMDRTSCIGTARCLCGRRATWASACARCSPVCTPRIRR